MIVVRLGKEKWSVLKSAEVESISASLPCLALPYVLRATFWLSGTKSERVGGGEFRSNMVAKLLSSLSTLGPCSEILHTSNSHGENERQGILVASSYLPRIPRPRENKIADISRELHQFDKSREGRKKKRETKGLKKNNNNSARGHEIELAGVQLSVPPSLSFTPIIK